MNKILIAFVLLVFLTGCSNYVNYNELSSEEKEAYIEIVSDEEGSDVKLAPGDIKYWISYNSCVDHDGRDYEVKGETVFKYAYKGESRSREKTDYCQGNEVREYICNKDRLAITTHECSSCADGKCSDSD